MTHLRVGAVRLGPIARVAHLPGLVRLSCAFAVTHVSDRSMSLKETVAAGLPAKPRTSTDWRSLCDDPQLDVLLLTPGASAPVAAAALEAGKHALSEKPLCTSRHGARKVVSKAAVQS